jgi:UDP-2-acetamido-2-deoxy-ribo-hexuluronate aminotransferase
MEFSGVQASVSTRRDSILNAIAKVLDHGRFVLGPEVFELEEKLARYVGGQGSSHPMHCITCASGTDALRLALMTLNIGPGDAVVVPAFGFAAAAEAVVLAGATPLFADIDPATFNLDANDVRRRMGNAQSGKVRALIAIDTFGLPSDYAALGQVCRDFGMALIEDAAQSLGGSYHGQRCGSLGDLAITSFYPTKPLGGLGDGGAVFTRNGDFAARLRRLRDHGQEGKYRHVEIGCNSRLDSLQAAVLLDAFAGFEEDVSQRRRWAKRYHASLPAFLKPPQEPDGYLSAWSVYTCLLLNRDALRTQLTERGIPTACHYPFILPELPAFAKYGDKSELFPEALRVSRQCLSLPLHAALTEEDLAAVVAGLTE